MGHLSQLSEKGGEIQGGFGDLGSSQGRSHHLGCRQQGKRATGPEMVRKLFQIPEDHGVFQSRVLHLLGLILSTIATLHLNRYVAKVIGLYAGAPGAGTC